MNTDEYTFPLPATLRDYFAGLALQGLLADHTVEMDTSEYAQWSYQLADEMLEERK
jgi:hypothetical protein